MARVSDGVARYVAVLALCLSIAAFVIPRGRFPAGGVERGSPSASEAVPGLLGRIDKTGELHAGYGVYPPYTQEDPNTGKVSGFSVAIIDEIASQLKCKVVWHRLNWNTMSADLKRGEYDVIADPIFETIPRAREFAFTEPYAYFPSGIGVVRKDDTRFTDFDSVNHKGVIVAVGQGWAEESLAKNRLPKATIRSVPTGTDLLEVLNEVTAGRADIAIVDGATAARFVKEHPNAVKALWMDNPPATMPAGFALRLRDRDSAAFLDVCIRILAIQWRARCAGRAVRSVDHQVSGDVITCAHSILSQDRAGF